MKKNTDDFYLGLALCPFLKTVDASEIIKNSKRFTGEIDVKFLKLYTTNYSLASKIKDWFRSFDLNYHKERLSIENIKLITLIDLAYPQLLKEIYTPPPFLFYKGDLSILKENFDISLAVVGSRKNSPESIITIDKIIKPICQLKKVLIISGLACGVDTLAHKCALTCGSKTIAVLGSGLYKENIYPSKNLDLAGEIEKKSGLLLSEFPPYAGPRKENFPRRNRIVSALAKSTLVIESRERSGALITARLACEQNKDVFAIPGNIFCENYKGNNRLIQAGAYPVLDHSDILNYYS